MKVDLVELHVFLAGAKPYGSDSGKEVERQGGVEKQRRASNLSHRLST